MRPIWIGIDDTDSPEGGCTTWVLTELLTVAARHGVDLVGEPRLVRLNPNIPWKTRGNAALSARFGKGIGVPRVVGEVDGHPVRSFPAGTELPDGSARTFVDAAWARVLASSSEEPGTDPALVATTGPLPEELYWNAVRDVVPIENVRGALERAGAIARVRGEPTGLVGAAAAIAWPAVRSTWELIAYRTPGRIGSPRFVDEHSVRDAANAEPDLFLCYDSRTRRLLVAPHTACPILFGLRATTDAAAVQALRRIRSEPVDRWVLFHTNQGTGDHLHPRTHAELAPYRSAIVEGTVSSTPRVRAGGHVQFELQDAAGVPCLCMAFEPTKTLPRVARDLREGDRVKVWGSCGPSVSIRLEGLQVISPVPRELRRPPLCPECGRRTRSLGRLRGYRCPDCRRRLPPETAVVEFARPRAPEGAIHPTPSARRHLAPLAPDS